MHLKETICSVQKSRLVVSKLFWIVGPSHSNYWFSIWRDIPNNTFIQIFKTFWATIWKRLSRKYWVLIFEPVQLRQRELWKQSTANAKWNFVLDWSFSLYVFERHFSIFYCEAFHSVSSILFLHFINTLYFTWLLCRFYVYHYNAFFPRQASYTRVTMFYRRHILYFRIIATVRSKRRGSAPQPSRTYILRP